MVESFIRGEIIVHRFVGDLGPRDIIDAKFFAQSNPEDTCVLWDLRKVTLGHLDPYYQVFAKALVDEETPNLNKRAVLVGSERHRQRVETVLAAATIPWSWAVFESESDALLAQQLALSQGMLVCKQCEALLGIEYPGV